MPPISPNGLLTEASRAARFGGIDLSAPLTILAAFFAVVATVEWQRLPLLARLQLGVATAFAVGALVHPGLSFIELARQGRDGVTGMIALAAAAGVAGIVMSLVAFLRDSAAR